MSKKPSLRNEYHAKKDRLEITIKHHAVSDRKDLLKHLLRWLEGRGPALAKATEKKVKTDELPKNPWKETKFSVRGD
jgi:hypothetical protein